MTTTLFGTDGIRGPFGSYPLDRATVVGLGRALGAALTDDGTAQVVLGGDTRSSTPSLCSWLATGLAEHGVETHYLGTVPTPAVAYLTRELGTACGIAVSASHNPMPDNGIKLIDSRGFKWTPEAERSLEERLASDSDPLPTQDLEPTVETSLVDRYLDYLKGTLPAGAPLGGLRVVLDCAHGAASPYAPGLFAELGAEVHVIGAGPDGENINDAVGSTHPESMAAAVTEESAALGIAFDGDADRALFADESGRLRDGDATLYLWSRVLAERGELVGDAIVATSMSNLGLEVALRDSGIDVVRCDVGDRVVVDTMRRHGLTLGGEQSGHVIHLGLATTGDGMLTALHVARLVLEGGGALSELVRDLPRFPQTLQNVRVREKPDLMSLPSVAAAAAEVEQRLGDTGRLVLRYSGTEPLARVMIEGPDQETIEQLARGLLGVIHEEIGLPG